MASAFWGKSAVIIAITVIAHSFHEVFRIFFIHSFYDSHVLIVLSKIFCNINPLSINTQVRRCDIIQPFSLNFSFDTFRYLFCKSMHYLTPLTVTALVADAGAVPSIDASVLFGIHDGFPNILKVPPVALVCTTVAYRVLVLTPHAVT